MMFEERATKLNHGEIVALLVSQQELAARVEELTRQLEWFKRQLFGAKSERRFLDPDGRQLALGEWRQNAADSGAEITVAEHRRRSRVVRSEEPDGEEPLRFDESVPVEEIRLPHPPLDDEHEIISEKTTFRLAQRPAPYVVLKYIWPVVKRKADGTLTCLPAPPWCSGRAWPVRARGGYSVSSRP